MARLHFEGRTQYWPIPYLGWNGCPGLLSPLDLPLNNYPQDKIQQCWTESETLREIRKQSACKTVETNPPPPITHPPDKSNGSPLRGCLKTCASILMFRLVLNYYWLEHLVCINHHSPSISVETWYDHADYIIF